MSYLLRTAKEIREKAAEHPAVLVAFSGGKDSLAVLDLCRRAFRQVVAFHLDFVPGLAVIRQRVDDYLKALGVECVHYPDPGAVQALRTGTLCDPSPAHDRLPAPKCAYRQAAADTGIPLVATGKKESDYRQRAFHLRGGRIFGWHPLRKWTKADVLGYLKRHGITPPESHAEAGGIDLTAASLGWLHDRHPADFKKLLTWFPYAEAVVKRRDWHTGPGAAAAEGDEARGVHPGERAPA